MASTTPARTSKVRPRPDEPTSDLEVISRSKDGETFTGRLFGSDEFEFSTDVNGMLLMLGFSGQPSDFVNLLHSMIALDDDADDEVRDETRKRFNKVLASQRHFPVERLMQLTNDLCEAAGNDELGNAATST